MGGTVQTGLYCDFFYYYAISKWSACILPKIGSIYNGDASFLFLQKYDTVPIGSIRDGGI